MTEKPLDMRHTAGDGWTDERKDAARQHFRLGLSGTESARLLVVSRCSVLGARHRMGLLNKRPTGPDEIELARKKETRRLAGNIATRQRDGLAVPGKSASEPVPIKTTAMPVLRCVETDAEPRLLPDCDVRCCRWPVSGESDQTLFCAAPKEPERAYCDAHARIAFRSAPKQMKETDGRRRNRMRRAA